jgi:proteic killer suppression protein
VEILYADAKIQRLCEEARYQQKQLGSDQAKRLRTRIAQLRAATQVLQLQLGRPHPLVGDLAGQFSVDLVHPTRLLFEPADHPPPSHPHGGIDWQQVSRIRILAIEDTHD